MTLSTEIFDIVRLSTAYTYDEVLEDTNKIINLFIEKIDIKLRNVENEQPDYWKGYLDALRELKQEIEKK